MGRRFWVSDEYGPYIYRFSADGALVQTIQPPEAIIPLDDDGNIMFTSEEDPATGRASNSGTSVAAPHLIPQLFGRVAVDNVVV